MREARIEATEFGASPADDGWFILNLTEIAWATVPGGGTWCVLESPASPSTTLGIGVHVLPPGEKPGFYHLESDQEGFLVLSGECLVIVEGEERRMAQWDYFHCPPGTAHITIGAGEARCAILMVGTRSPDHTLHYPAEPAAARHGAAVAVATDSPREAYAERPPMVPARSPWPL
ncbi:MAG: cupin domain-containing protein [Actinomycetota bacterium]|nr:cupin domain-containing protein [Actinomycetota bacterium]